MERRIWESTSLHGQRQSSRGALAVHLTLASAVLAGCGEQLPDDLSDYRTRCLLMASGIAETSDDPHRGVKDVYACDVDEEFVKTRGAEPFPDGTVIVKESTRADSDFPWLVATTRKSAGQWSWNEYSRNFSDEPFIAILPGEQVCIDCHKKVEALDWIYTRFSEAPPP